MGQFWRVGILTLPLSSPPAAAVPAYNELIAPYDTGYAIIRMIRCTIEPE
jgi:hypothetical protein